MIPIDLAALFVDLPRIKAYCEATTPEPWCYFSYRALPFDNEQAMDWQCEHLKNWQEGTELPWCSCANPYEVEGASIRGPTYIANPEQTIFRPEDAKFCSEARTDLPRLIAALEQMAEERDALMAAYDDLETKLKVTEAQLLINDLAKED